ncbi:S-layer homology domain-containing protein, partial [Paenibacillus sp. GYB004]|uniref:S-layer homology domain-containing protein n=1 Tax=Paenibacillus sp. GYB004 TaxID=2994393 RepID=UPI002F96588D
NEGGSVTLSVYATVSQGTLSYQWYRNTSPVIGGFAVNGATSAMLTKTMAGVGDDYYYVVVTNTDSAATGNKTSTATSGLAKVTVNALTHAAAPTITTQPQDQSVNEGGSVTLSVYATVSQGTLSYQWYRNTSPVIGGFAVNGATSATLTKTMAGVGDDYYYVIVTNTDSAATGNKMSTATSGLAKVTVNALTHAAAPTITTQPQGRTLNEGDSYSLSAAATVSQGVLSYQWYRNSVNDTNGAAPVLGATSSSYLVPTPGGAEGYFYVMVTNTDSSATGRQTETAVSDVVKITVIPVPKAADAAGNSLTASRTIVWAGETVMLQATGDRQDMPGTTTGDERYIPTGWSSTDGTSGTFHLNANRYLASYTTGSDGNHTVTAAFQKQTWNGSAWTNAAGSTDSKTAGITVNALPTYTIEAIGNQTAAVLKQGYVPGTQDSKTIGITNTGNANLVNLRVVFSGGHSSDFVLTQPASTLNSGASTSFTVQAKDGLAAGTYTATITVMANSMTNVTFTVTQQVNPGTPAAPTGVQAVAGDGQATLTFTPPTDDGGSAITGYEVIVSPGGRIVTGASSPITVTGLSNDTSYTFAVRALNSSGEGAPSAASNAVVPTSSSSEESPAQEESATSVTPPVEEPKGKGATILVNGKPEQAGIVETTVRNGQTVLTITLDPKSLENKLTTEQRPIITLSVDGDGKPGVVIGELNGQLVKTLANRQAVIEIQTGRTTYILPVERLGIDALSAEIGETVALEDIRIQIEISEPAAEMLQVAEAAAAQGGFHLVLPPIDYTIRAVHGGSSIPVSSFDAYVERQIALPDGVDPNKITTGVVIGPDGTVRHVPTRIVVKDGKYYAVIHSLTNSTYALIWNPLEFEDTANHWAIAAVNDMGSRLIVSGVGGNRFRPDQDITRAEFAAIMVRGLGMEQGKDDASFTDVTAASWYSGAVQTAYGHDLISGFEDGSFRPDDQITREQAMVIIAKAMELTGLAESVSSADPEQLLKPFIDTEDVSEWARSGVAAGLQSGIVTGRDGGLLAPQAFISKAEAAVIVRRLLQKSELID